MSVEVREHQVGQYYVWYFLTGDFKGSLSGRGMENFEVGGESVY